MNSIEATRNGFEASFAEADFYNKQTQDETHLNKIMDNLAIGSGMRILDLGCGSGYLTFPIAKKNIKNEVIGLDIVTNTLMENGKKAFNEGFLNLEFVSYNGNKLPFEDNYFDLIVTRYALHHFPDINKSIGEVARVLKPCGRFFISDPRPNEIDDTRFVDDYMQLKKDGHIKFYTKDEWIGICGDNNMNLVSEFDSEITFPKKKATADGYKQVIEKHDTKIVESYNVNETEDEIWITEQVNNVMFAKC